MISPRLLHESAKIIPITTKAVKTADSETELESSLSNQEDVNTFPMVYSPSPELEMEE